MGLRCPKCYSNDFYESGMGAEMYICRECGYHGYLFFEMDDDAAVPELRKHNKIAPIQYDETDFFSPWGPIVFIILVVSFLGLVWIVLGPHPK
jgi:hypothetical protein